MYYVLQAVRLYQTQEDVNVIIHYHKCCELVALALEVPQSGGDDLSFQRPQVRLTFAQAPSDKIVRFFGAPVWKSSPIVA